MKAKNVILRTGFTAVWMASAGTIVFAAALEAPKAATAPAATAVSPTLAEPYKILLTRSIFSRDGRAAYVPTSRSRRWGSSDPLTQPSTAPTSAPAPDPEANFVLRGVGMQDGVFTAFFEQTSESRGVSRHVGEIVAHGQIMRMSLDGVDYSFEGKVTHVQVGQDLDGQSTAGTTSTATATSPGGDWRSKWHRSSEAPATAPAAPSAGTAPQTPTADNRENAHSRAERERARWAGKPSQPPSDPSRPAGDAQADDKQPNSAQPPASAGPSSRPAPPEDGGAFELDTN